MPLKKDMELKGGIKPIAKAIDGAFEKFEDFAEEFLKTAAGVAGLEEAIFGVGLFSELGDVIEAELGDPALEHESRDVEAGFFLFGEFDSVVKGGHERQRPPEGHGIGEARK